MPIFRRRVPEALAPGPAAPPLIGHLLEMRKDPLGLFRRAVRDHGPRVRFRFGPYNLLLLNRPEDIRHVLVENHDNYVKSPSYSALRAILGRGLLTSEGELWRRQRKLLQPVFQPRHLADFAAEMARFADATAASWMEERRSFDVHEEMMALTLRIVGQTLLGTELGRHSDKLGDALDEILVFREELRGGVARPLVAADPRKAARKTSPRDSR